ncbi:polyhydroxyalkanoic acid inclusion protein PhaP [Aneurinibacillus soli]|uniref:Polyhydroxyalkanoic acid inclusion protein n=1 Tax=Aneurinibacillus soli TaxID=1500254 RepID=A0A0U5BM48_9BACL|nr:polyhydroxyalkanoic acid inclusion protein PhaP [Aneurinibacillus soli]PYE57266.1 polyhydroxyalkanoic acid inclusion protein PhaP [Aneurinibacillus soli]BAU29262.1 polyhydroxyalkanoic acid inclusion protein [Aneurinibacillus soli]
MAVNKKAEKESVTVQATTQQNPNIVDAVWDGWMNSVKTIYAYQREIENITLQTLDRQKELWTKTAENIEKTEQELKKFLEEAKFTYQSNVKNVGGEQAGQIVQDWLGRLDEISSRIQQLTWTPGKASINVINKSQEQLELSVKSLIEQQQRTREEVQNLVDNFLGQVKSTQKGLINSLEANKNNTINLFK